MGAIHIGAEANMRYEWQPAYGDDGEGAGSGGGGDSGDVGGGTSDKGNSNR